MCVCVCVCDAIALDMYELKCGEREKNWQQTDYAAAMDADQICFKFSSFSRFALWYATI